MSTMTTPAVPAAETTASAAVERDDRMPAGIKFIVETPTRLAVSGADKELVGQIAADIRQRRKPEPYKGKGIRYQGEQILRKAGKAGKVGGAK